MSILAAYLPHKLKDVIATANRLHMIQVDLAEETDQVRREQLNEEIERALAKIVPEQRRAFLEELRDRFPCWEKTLAGGPQAAAAVEHTATSENQLNDPEFLVEKLTGVVSSLTEAKKQLLVEKLRESGLLPDIGRDWPQSCSKRLQKIMSLSDETEITSDHIAQLIAMMFDFVTKLDPLIWSTWRKVSPRSSIRFTGDLKEVMLGAISQKKDLSECQAMLEKLRCLTAGIVSAFGQAGNQFTRYYMSKFSPSQISSMVDMEGGTKIWEAREVKYWRKYIELANSLNDASSENEIMDQITKYAESLMKGLGR